MLKKLDDHYVVSLTCDPKLQPFYEGFGMRSSGGMVLLNRDRCSGVCPDV